MALNSDVGWLSACRLMSACSSVDDLSRYPDSASKTPINSETIYVGRSTDFGSADETINNTQAG